MAEAMAPESCFQRARQALATSPIHAMREIRVAQDGETLVLSGRVKTFYHKQLAQEVVRAVAREIDLVNSINVVS